MQKEVIVHDINYHLGLLHFAYLLVMVDGELDERERNMMEAICKEESIASDVYSDFLKSASGKSERQIYDDGLRHLQSCTMEEKTATIVYLFKLSEADNNIHRKEVRLLFYSLEMMDVDFEDVELSARMADSRLKMK